MLLEQYIILNNLNLNNKAHAYLKVNLYVTNMKWSKIHTHMAFEIQGIASY